MSENGPTSGSPGPAEPVVEHRRGGISPIWIIPIVALVLAAGLAYRAIEQRGPRVVVVFESAQGLVAGKSKVKYRDIEIGMIDEIRLRDSTHVEVHCSLDKGTGPHLTERTKWWVVRPRIGHGAISGIGTLLSGAYLTFEPGPQKAAAQREFVGLAEPPLPSADAPGLAIVLHAEDLGGLDHGSPIFFRDIHVGDVRQFAFSQDGTTVDIQAVIYHPYAHQVHGNSRFWNAGGVDFSLDSSGLHVKTETLSSIFAGGIAFESPGGGTPAKPGAEFWLHGSESAVRRTARSHGGLGLVLETPALGGVAPGNPVYYRELPVGAVVSRELASDGSGVRIRVNVEERYASLVRADSVFWNAGGISADLGIHGLHVHAESLKALLSGGVSFATPPKPGQRVTEGSVFALHHEAKKEWMEWETDFGPEPADAGQATKAKPDSPARFFHHEGKSEEAAARDDPTPEPTTDERKHHFLRRLLHHGG